VCSSDLGVLRNVSFEAIAAAKKIDEGAEVVALLLGDTDLSEQGQEMIHYGADRTITVQHDNLKNYTSEAYGQVVMQVMEEESPTGVVMGHTAIGKGSTPNIAARHDLGLISDATDIEKDGDKAVFTRPIYSGKAFEKKVIKEGITFATIRPNNIAVLEKDESRSGDVAAKDIDVKDLRTIVK